MKHWKYTLRFLQKRLLGASMMASCATQAPFLNLNGETATSTNVETKIVGKVPDWLEGSLYRNGPGVFQVGVSKLKHLFDGFATLHHYRMSKGKVWYTSRVLDTETWTESVKANRLTASQFGTYLTPDPCKTIYGKLMSFFKHEDDMTDNTGVSVVEFGDALYAMTETPWVNKIDPKTLQVANKEDLRKVLAIHWSTAHPHFDKDGTMYNLGTSMTPNEETYHIVKISPKESPDAGMLDKAKRLVGLKSRWRFTISYNHSFGMSRSHFVILEQPIAMQPIKMLFRNVSHKPPNHYLTKYPTVQTLFRVVRRLDNKEVGISFCTDPMFCFHFVNCHEEAGHLVVDLVGYTDLDILDHLQLQSFKNGIYVEGGFPLFQRYVLPLTIKDAQIGENLVTLPHSKASAVLQANGSVYLKPDTINNMEQGGVPMELPRINYSFNGSKYRYVYGTFFLSQTPRLVKLDLETGQVKTWRDEGYQPGEPVFVARPGATAEDDGVILSPVLGEREGQKCYLLILDAASFEEIGRAVLPDGVNMSATFHGSYVAPKPPK